jgi:catechol 2,3-dioxygenase-like lactoylglutathione lyase family enzyme
MGDRAFTFVGLHHVRLPVSDLMRSRDWYIDVFGFAPQLTFEAENEVIGIVLGHPSGLILGLHHEPARARALRGFSPIGLNVGTTDDLDEWCARLDVLQIRHSEPAEAHLGWCAEVFDPDGLVIELHTASQPSADEA